MTDSPTYHRIEQFAEDYPDLSAAEIHGALSGMLCSDRGLECDHWLIALFAEEAAHLTSTERDLLTSLYLATRDELASLDLVFYPLLPDDNEPLAERTRALGDWCQGFLFGFGQGAGERNWSSESDEVLRDLVEISRIEPEPSSAENEEAYAEIAEYVRIAVQLIRGDSELHPRHRLH